MALDALLARLERRAVTPVTADAIADVTPKPAPVLACTPVTPVTSENYELPGYFGVTGAEPLGPIRQLRATLTANNDAAIRAWLAQIRETDPAIIDHVLDQCRTDVDARGYFMQATQGPATERRRGKALAMLDADPKLQIAIVVENRDADPVVITVARRGYTGEIEIPRAYYNLVTLQKLLDRHSVGLGVTP